MISTLLSCEDFFESTLELDAPDYERQLVIGAALNDNSNYHQVIFSMTTGIDEDPQQVDMDDANLWLEYPNGSRYYFINQNSPNKDHLSEFYIDFNPSFEEEKTYILKGNKPGYDTIWSMAKVPSLIPLTSYTYKYEGGVNEIGAERSAIDIIFRDPPGVRNFYKVGVLINQNVNDDRYYVTYTSSLDPSVVESADDNFALISDEVFDGEEKRISLQFEKKDTAQVRNLHIIWNVISEEQYRYDKELKSYEINAYNPFAASTQINSYMRNGLGFFGIENREVYDVK